jgi:hypothetical protein
MPDPDPDPAPPPTRRRQREWEKHAKGKSAPPGRTAQLVAVLLLMAVVGGALVVYLTAPKDPPKPRLYSFAVERFTNLPELVVPGGKEDGSLLEATFERVAVDQSKLTRDSIRKLLDEIAGLNTSGPDSRDDPLVVHLSGVAMTAGDAVYLLPGDGQRTAPGSWLPVADILEAVGKCPIGRKLLILDLSRPAADPFTGHLRDDAAALLDRLIRDRKPAYPVLVSTGPGQFSWPAAAPAKSSAFGMYLADGLGGRADGADGSPRDGYRITVGELFQFTRNRVARYARRVWGAAQEPQLYTPDGKDWDFDLVYRRLPESAPHEPIGDPGKYPDDLLTRWAFLDKLRAAGQDRERPVLFALLVARTLMVAEREWQADGEGYTGKSVRRPEEEWARAGSGSATSPAPDDTRRKVRGLRLATLEVKEPFPPAWKVELERYVQALRVRAAKQDKGQELAPAEEAQLDAAKRGWLTAYGADPRSAAVLVWRELVTNSSLPRDAVVAYATVLTELWDGQPPALEVLYLQALARRNFVRDAGLSDHPAEAVAAGLAAEDKLALAVLLEPTAFAAVADRVAKADEVRSQALARLFEVTTSDGVRDVRDGFRTATTGFTDAVRDARKADAAAKSARTAVEMLTYTLPLALADGDVYPRWLDTAAKAATAGDPEALEVELNRLAAPFDKAALDQVLQYNGPWGEPKELRRYERLLAGPTFRDFGAEQRRAVWNRVRDRRRDLHNEVRKADDEDDEKRMPTDPVRDNSPADERTPVRRARAALALLELTRGPAADVRREVDALEARPADGRQADTTGKVLVTAWGSAVPGPVVPPGAALVRGQTKGDSPDPASAADREAVAAYLRWVAKQLGGYAPLERLDKDQKYFGQRLTLSPN